MKRLFAMCLGLVLSVSLIGCKTIQSEDLMTNIKQKEIAGAEATENENGAVTDFAVRLFQNSIETEKNTLISPLSVLVALSMTANGADEETLSQMEDVLVMPMEVLNTYIYTYMEKLSEGKDGVLSLADSIWFTDDEKFSVNEEFLQLNADYYGADIYKTPFNNETCKDVNHWVEEKTDGMIEEILDNVSEEAVMYLVNALAFDAEWQKVYEKTQVQKERFTTESGQEQEAELMYSSENQYLEDENAKGFVKFYAGGQYAFAALLPNEGISVEEYVRSLTGLKVRALLSNAEDIPVDAAIPKFETEYETEMSEVLKEMGMVNAFDADLADFTRLGTYEDRNIYIDRILHKTFISVAEKGTKAGAATVVGIETMSAMPTEEPKQVILNRPFVYMLIDCEQQVPFFMGTVMSVE